MEEPKEAASVVTKPRRRRKWGRWVLAIFLLAILAGMAFIVRETRPLPTITLPDGTKARVSFGSRGVADRQNWRSFPHHTDSFRFINSPPDRWRWWKDKWNGVFGYLPDWVKARTKSFPKATINNWSLSDPRELLFEVTGGDADRWPWTVYVVDEFGLRSLLLRIHDPISARGMTKEEGWEAVGQSGPFPTRARKLRLQIEAPRKASDTGPPAPVVAEMMIDNPFFESGWPDPGSLRRSQPLDASTITLVQATPGKKSVGYPWDRTEFVLRFREEPWNLPEEGHYLCAMSFQTAEGGWERVPLVGGDSRPSEKVHLITARARAWPSDGPWRFRTWWFPAWSEARPPIPSFQFVKVPIAKTGQTLAVSQSSESGGATLKLTSIRGEDDSFVTGWKDPAVAFWLSGWHPPTGKPFRLWRTVDSKGRTSDPRTGLPYEMREIDMDLQRGYRCSMSFPPDVEWFDVFLTSAAPTMIQLDVMPDAPK